tara:strand:+ start:1896 stop:2207 length:312 start_codon:yes stop_codon:yes gene_type:complete
MFEDHIYDFFGENLDSWLDANDLILLVGSWSEVEVLPDNHPDHEKSLEEYMESEELAFEISGNEQVSITIGYTSAKVLEISENFPEQLLAEMKDFAPGFQADW